MAGRLDSARHGAPADHRDRLGPAVTRPRRPRRARAAPGRARAGALAPGPRGARGRARRGHRDGRGGGREARLPAGADALALLRRDRRRAGGGRRARGADPRRAHDDSSPPAARPSTASTSTPRSTSARRTAGWATTPRSSSGPTASVVARTRKLHIPVTAGYYEDKYFRPGDDAEGYPVVALGDARFGFPTCWDQWFPELARPTRSAARR